MLNSRVCASAFVAILYDCIIVQRSIPRPRHRQQPAMHLMFHQGRVRPRHRQSRGTWRRRCWLRCETRPTAVTCYGAPSTSLRPQTMRYDEGYKLNVGALSLSYVETAMSNTTFGSILSGIYTETSDEVKRGLRLHRESCMKLDITR